MKNKHHITAGCYLVRRHESEWQLFMIYKKWSEEDQGWVLPKGHVEEGETLEEAAIRETAEETGYFNIELVDKVGKIDIVYLEDDGEEHTKEIHYYLAKLVDEKRVELKLSANEQRVTVEMGWFEIGKAEEMIMFDDERGLFVRVKEKLVKNSNFYV